MTDVVSAQASQHGTASPGLGARVAGILLEPAATYAAVAAHPRWLGVMLLTLGLSAAASYVSFSSPELQGAILDQQIRTILAGGGAVSEQQLAGMEAIIGNLGLLSACAILLFGPLLAAAVAGILLTIFTTLLGGQGTFRQLFALVSHAGVISMVGALFSAGMMAAGVEPDGMRPPGASLGIFAPMLEETSFAAALLGAIDLFWVWWLVSLGIGLGVLYRRSATAITTTFIGLYVVVALLIAMVRAGS